jgi:hypothetical protein
VSGGGSIKHYGWALVLGLAALDEPLEVVAVVVAAVVAAAVVVAVAVAGVVVLAVDAAVVVDDELE